MDIDKRYVPFKKDNGKWTYKDTETGELLDFEFKDCNPIREGYGVVELDYNKCTYFNAKTGKLLDFECKLCTHIFEGYGVIWLDDDKRTYFNAKTGKLLDAEFNDISLIRHGYGRIQLDDGKWTYFDGKTGKLLDERFINIINAVSHGRGAVELEDGKWYIFNLETREYSQEVKFDNLLKFVGGYALGESYGNRVIYNFIDNEVFYGEPTSSISSIAELIQKYPENFLKLNVYSFGDSDKIREYLNAAQKGLTERIEAINPEDEQAAVQIGENYVVIEEIEKFCKKKFAEYKVIRKKEKEAKEKEENIKDIANAKDKINKLGNILNLDDEERNDD